MFVFRGLSNEAANALRSRLQAALRHNTTNTVSNASSDAVSTKVAHPGHTDLHRLQPFYCDRLGGRNSWEVTSFFPEAGMVYPKNAPAYQIGGQFRIPVSGLEMPFARPTWRARIPKTRKMDTYPKAKCEPVEAVESIHSVSLNHMAGLRPVGPPMAELPGNWGTLFMENAMLYGKRYRSPNEEFLFDPTAWRWLRDSLYTRTQGNRTPYRGGSFIGPYGYSQALYKKRRRYQFAKHRYFGTSLIWAVGTTDMCLLASSYGDLRQQTKRVNTAFLEFEENYKNQMKTRPWVIANNLYMMKRCVVAQYEKMGLVA